MNKIAASFGMVGLLGVSMFAQQPPVVQSKGAQNISGDYVETRSADVYTGQCFANGEMGLAGDQAILAWRIQEGGWDGVSLAGLSVVGAVKAQATLGDPYGQPYPAKTVLMVDRQATPQQRQALINFAQEMGGELFRHVVKVMDVPIDMAVGQQQHHGRASIRAGELVTIETRAIGDKDHLCGNETTFYPPLTETTHAMPAVAMTDEFLGQGLNTTWTLHDKRSAFVGNFEHRVDFQGSHESLLDQPRGDKGTHAEQSPTL
ncbi:MAG TPA: DUF1326 domain-containing protein [Candidatus Saccharimonadales bacterium]|jgi:hypothetical protein|nr:DUF1326 domain-containing protein [Candidatus Saccharimonadales bacterium]